jgi:hypothetical protein
MATVESSDIDVVVELGVPLRDLDGISLVNVSEDKHLRNIGSDRI